VASKQSNVDFVLEQMADAGEVSAKKMFGEYALYLQGKIIALFCDDQLFIKPTDAGRTLLGKVKEAPPYPGAKPWFLISGDRCEDGDFLSKLASTTAKALPAPKPKAPKKAKKKPQTKAAAPAKKKPPSARNLAARDEAAAPGDRRVERVALSEAQVLHG
jgi:TfoX/Sxy family transcriptional regulator of competence genes